MDFFPSLNEQRNIELRRPKSISNFSALDRMFGRLQVEARLASVGVLVALKSGQGGKDRSGFWAKTARQGYFRELDSFTLGLESSPGRGRSLCVFAACAGRLPRQRGVEASCSSIERGAFCGRHAGAVHRRASGRESAL